MLKSFKFCFFAIFILFSLVCLAQDKSIPVLKIENNILTLAEFEKEYLKSHGNKDSSKDSLKSYKEFLDLYSGFKLKILDAKSKGYDTNTDLLNEFEEYKKNVSRTFYQTKYIKKPGLKRYYQQSMQEFRVSHILILSDSTRDFTATENFAKLLIDSLKNGADWNKFVKKYSGDENTIADNGDLYYYSGAKIQGEFLQALLTTDVNQIYSMPMKSRFGHHILKVTEKNIAIPAVRAKHILINHKDSTGAIDDAKAKKLSEELRERVLKGESFDKLAKKYSDDKGSGAKGGDLNFLPRRTTVNEFDQVLFNTKPGEVSEVFKTRFGYHFLTVVERQKNPSFKEFVKSASKTYEGTFYKQDFSKYIDSLAVLYNYTIKDENIGKINEAFSQVRVFEMADTIESYKKMKDLVLINTDNKKITFENIIDGASSVPALKTTSLSMNFLKYLVRKKVEDEVLSFEMELLEKNDTEFQAIMKDYKNGLMIFKLQENDIWKDVKISEEDKQEYFEENKNSFNWPKRLVIQKINHHKKTIVDSMVTVLKGKNEITAEALKDFSQYKITRDTILATAVNRVGRAALKLNEGEFSDSFRSKTGYWTSIYLIKKLDVTQKTYEESESEITSKLLELKNKAADKKYIDGLKEEYEPEYFYENLKQAFK